MTLTVEWLEDPQRWSELRDPWDLMAERSAWPTIYATWDFLDCCRLHFAPRRSRLAIAVVREGRQAVGFAPMLITQRQRFGLPMRQLGLLASWEADRAPLVVTAGREGECIEALLAAIAKRARDWDYLQLNELAPEAPLVAALRGWATAARGFRLVESHPSPSPFINLETDVDGWLASLGASTRKSFRRYQRQLEALGRCELEMCDAPETIGPALERYLEIEDRSWKRGAGQGVAKDQRNRAFYRDALPRLAARRRGAVALLTVDGKPIAGNIELWLGRVGYCPQTTFDPEFARYSPGNVLQVMTLRWHHARGIKEYGLFGRFLENKRRFTQDFRANLNLRVLQMRSPRHWILFTPGLLRREQARPKPVVAPASGATEENGEA